MKTVRPKACCMSMTDHLADWEAREGIEWAGEQWVVNGCCHGGCCVLTWISYCPWCGTYLADPSA